MGTLQSLDLPGRVYRHPYQSLFIAAGVGYVLGGGLFTKLTMRVLRTGMRIGALPIVHASSSLSPRPRSRPTPRTRRNSATEPCNQSSNQPNLG